MGKTITEAVVVSKPTRQSTQEPMEIALFNPDGTAKVNMNQAATQATFAGADITALKVELNAFLTKLKAAGIVA